MRKSVSYFHANNALIIQTFLHINDNLQLSILLVSLIKCNGKEKRVGSGNVEYLKIINIKQVLGEIWRIDNTYFGKCQ